MSRHLVQRPLPWPFRAFGCSGALSSLVDIRCPGCVCRLGLLERGKSLALICALEQAQRVALSVGTGPCVFLKGFLKGPS